MFSDTDSVGEYKTGGKCLTTIRATVRWTHKPEDQPVLQGCPGYDVDVKLHPLREPWIGDRTVLPVTRSLQTVRLPIKGASRAAIDRGFGLDTILGEQNTASKPPGKQPQSTKHIGFFFH